MTNEQAKGSAAPLPTGGRFLRDTRGNILPMAVAALIPVLAMVGGAIDLSRMHMTKTRLQQACDAGALAARRGMTDATTLTASDRDTALGYFRFNFPDGTYAAGVPSVDYARGEVGSVVGTAALAMPTTIMKMFGYATMPLSVTCRSTLVVPNADIMFVLDATGSMAETPLGDTQTKLGGLKQAVKDFYVALGPGTGSGPGRVRYGFMPYSSNVNVGKIVYGLNHGYIAGGNGSELVDYRSREAVLSPQPVMAGYGPETVDVHIDDPEVTDTWSNASSVGSFKSLYRNMSEQECTALAIPERVVDPFGSPKTTTTNYPAVSYPQTTQTKTTVTTQVRYVKPYRYLYTPPTRLAESRCQLQHRSNYLTLTTTTTTSRTVIWQQKFLYWNHVLRKIDVSGIVQNGVAANPAYFVGPAPDTNPNINPGEVPTTTLPTVTWNGCIEEARTLPTITASSALAVPSDAHDLNIDLIPYDTATRWKPFMPSLQYQANGYWLGRAVGWINNGFAACPREAAPLMQYQADFSTVTKLSQKFEDYVNSLNAVGGTYHDIGMIWGARFLSPTGIYAATNADSTGPGGFPISRHIVFMTDGKLDTRDNANDPWGVNNLEGRIAPAGTISEGLNDIHRRRTSMICDAMKGKGFTVWIVGFGITTMPTELQACATDATHWSLAANSVQLRTRFRQIAKTIGGLRLSQ